MSIQKPPTRVFLFLFILTSLALGAPQEDPTREMVSAREALLEGNLDAAVGHLRKAADTADREEALFRLASTLIDLKRFDEALSPINELEGEFPGGAYFHKARFLEARALEALKRFDEASALYGEEVARLLSKERKEEVAHFYIKYAKSLSDPEREGGPQYAKAVELYRHALDLQIPGSLDEEIRLKIAGLLHEMGSFGEEEQVLAEFKKLYPESNALDEADYRLAEARLKMNRHAEARRAFREFLFLHPTSPRVPEAHLGIALTYFMPEPRNDQELTLGVKALEDFLRISPRNPKAPEAMLNLGRAYHHRGRLDEAAAAFEKLIKRYAEKPDTKELASARITLGGVKLKQKKFSDALSVFNAFLVEHPSHHLWDDAQRYIVDTEYAWCLHRMTEKEYDRSRDQLTTFCMKHPLDARTPDAYYALGALEVERKNFEAAVEEWEKLVSKYPETEEASQAQFRIGRLHETELKDLAKAIEAYEKVKGPFASQAVSRIRAMKSKYLKATVKRAFTTAEPATIKIATRNIEKLDFRAYRVDLRDYFMNQNAFERVAALDIDLIEPDDKWESEVEDYIEYGEITREETLPFKLPGAYLVNVSDGKRNATVLVMVTDLQMILKSGREDVLVFVEDVKDKVPFEGAEVLVSDGSKVLLRGVTGKDGVFHEANEALKSTKQLRVLVASNGNYASNTLPLGDLAVAEGLTPKAYLFTDRTVYRPGATVRLKGFLREVDKGQYFFEEGATYTLSLFSPSGVEIVKRDIALDAFGGIDTRFAIDAAAPVGRYRFQVTSRSGWQHALTFPVMVYTQPKAEIAVEMKKDVFHPGETIEGTFKVRYSYGEPVKDKPLKYHYGTGVHMEKETDARGEVLFSIDSRDFAESGVYTLVAEVPEEGAAVRKAIYFSTTGFSLSASSTRDVVLAGEPLTISIEAKSADRKPVAADVELRLLKLEVDERGLTSEREIDKISVDVLAREGRGVAAVTLDEGGQYRFRAAARDRFGNVITADCEAFVSGEADKVKLRLFASEAVLDAGASVEMGVHMRCDENLVLLTSEGERLFEYRVERLKQGMNLVPLQIKDHLAPNFTFAAAIMDGHRLHTAQVDLKVRASLVVTVEPESEEAQPGDEIELRLKVTDRSGQPVEGEFAVAFVDSALLARFPDATVPIHSFFFGRERKGRLKTQSSCTFSFEAKTREIDRTLLEEMERRQWVEEDMDAVSGSSAFLTSKGSRADLARVEKKRFRGAGDVVLQSGLREKLKSLGYTSGNEPATLNDVIGVGGGAGGSFGGRYGGKRRQESLRDNFLETAYWNPSVVTGSDGMVVINVELPDNITTWKIMARGLDRKTSGGQGEASLTVRKKLFAFLDAPAKLVEGDKAVFQGRIVNRTGHDVTANATLELKRADGNHEHKREVKIKADAEATVDFDVAAGEVGIIEARLSVQAEHRTDFVQRTIEVAPYGVPVYAGKSGTASDSASVKVQLPGNRTYTTREMEIVLGPSFSDYLLHMNAPTLRGTVADVAGRLLVKLHALDYVRRIGQGDTAPMERDIEQLLADLLLLQNPSGAFPWIKQGNESLLASGQALKAMGLACKLGFNVPDKNKVSCLDWIRNKQRNLQGVDKIYCLHAISFADKPDFTELNRIYRNRNSLRNNEAAMLALAFLSAGYKDQAGTLVEILLKNKVFDTPLVKIEDVRNKRAGGNPWLENEVSTLAHAVRCLATVQPSHPSLKKGADELMERLSFGWHASFAQAAGAGALCEYLSIASIEASHYRLEITVNGKPLETIEVNGPELVRTLRVDKELLSNGENEVKFAYSGRGSYAYAVKLTGFTPDIVPPPRRLNAEHPYRIERTYHQAPLKYKGRTASQYNGGWNTIQWRDGESSWENRLTTLNQGAVGLVEIETDSYFYHYKEQRCWHAVAVTDTLPAGSVVLESGIQGNHSRYELGQGTITFFFDRDDVRVVYPVVGAYLGDYRSPPTVMRSLYDFNLYASANKGGTLKVNPKGTASVDTYRMKPDELYHFGLWKYEDGDYEGAKELLNEFMTKYLPKQQNLTEAAGTLFKIAFKQDDDQGLIRYFELLREKLPSFTLSFMETARVARAYRNTGEHEQALQLCAMIAGASFNRESKVAEALEKQGEFDGAVDYMKSLILTYPDLPIAQTALFALGQRVLDLAGPEGGKPRIPKRSRNDIIRHGILLVEEFLITYPKNPVADQAAYTLISTLLDREQSTLVAELCPVFLKRWPKSKLKSSMEYAEAFALFETGKYDEARGMLTHVADREDRGLTPAERDDRDLARYILGQIEHAGGLIEAALERYKQVKDKFEDAKEASDFFNRRELSLPEVSTFQTGKPVKLILTYCNMKQVKLSAYKVDLMKLYLARKSLKNITDINLAGIAPIVALDIPLGEGKDYKDMKKRIDLPLKDKGAYLLVVQGDESGCSGMVLVSDLSLDVQEEAPSGRVRVNVKDALSGTFQKNVYMKVIGSGNEAFLSGYTDLRGIFVADDIAGTSTVIADRDGEYAFHRGKVVLQPSAAINVGQELQLDKKRKAPQGGARNRALQNIFKNQMEIQQKGQQMMNEIYQQADEGVQIK